MSLNTKPPEYASMSIDQLQFALDKQISLKSTLKLPDGGHKLDQSISRLKLVLAAKTKHGEVLQAPFFQTKSAFKTINKNAPAQPPKLPIVDEDDDDEDIADILGNLSLKTPITTKDAIGETLGPVEPLSVEEIKHLRIVCNLPAPPAKDTPVHPFILRLVQLDQPYEGLVCLTAISCRDTDRRITRLGALSTWPILPLASKSQSPAAPKLTPEEQLEFSTARAADAICDLWQFIRRDNGSSHNRRPLLLASAQTTLDNLRRLVCSASVRHSRKAQMALPRDVLFSVVLQKDNVAEDVESRTPPPAGHPPLASAVEAEVNSCLRPCERLRKVEQAWETKSLLRTTAWLEAPMNVMMLRLICQAPSHVETTPSYSPSASTGDPPATNAQPLLLQHPSTSLLKCLAARGLSPTSLYILAGQGGWRGFVGFLRANRVVPKDNADDIEAELAPLYRHFRRVHRGLSLNAELYRETETTNMTSILPSSAQPSPLLGSPLSGSVRQIKTLSMPESLSLMKRVHDDFKAFQSKTKHSNHPTMPPESAFLTKYRERPAEDSDDTLTQGDEDEEDENNSDDYKL